MEVSSHSHSPLYLEYHSDTAVTCTCRKEHEVTTTKTGSFVYNKKSAKLHRSLLTRSTAFNESDSGKSVLYKHMVRKVHTGYQLQHLCKYLGTDTIELKLQLQIGIETDNANSSCYDSGIVTSCLLARIQNSLY